ncbi:MAG: sulfite exporter TauE/SafE family protein [Proteobacteria bacterium]|nr:sulfite exporter TauE/SafE family protein [Pseudomonadota bacterium]MCP4919276.1 sulfite exporter TauE/SafE family protein [Pseudomonadota bacterium]
MTLVLASIAIAFAQLVRGVTGFGSALVGVQLLAFLFAPQDAIFLVCFVDAIGSLALGWDVRKLLRWVVVLSVFPGIFVGQYVGTELLLILPERTVALVLAAVVSVFAVGLVFRPVRSGGGEWTELPESKAVLVGMPVVGFMGGVMSGLVGAGGPPIVIYFKRFFAQEFFRAQLIWIFLFSSYSLFGMLTFKGAADVELLPTAALLLVPMFVGNRAGAWLAPRVPPALFGRIVGALLLGTSVLMVFG